MAARDRVVDYGFKVLNGFHRTVLRVTGGRLGSKAFGMDAVELRSVGRRSGLVRRTMLTVPVTYDGVLVLVASKGGDVRFPDWYYNVVAHPEVEILRHGELLRVRARVATPEETHTLWPQVVGAYGPYAGYQRRAKREIPLVLCEPR